MASKQQPESNYPILLRDEATSFDPEAFDNLIHEQGVTFVHWRAMACPLGMVDPDDDRHPHEEHAGCSNGFLYTLAGKMTCGFVGNSKDSRLTDMGRMDGSSAQIVLPRFYDQDSPQSSLVPVEVAPFDRLYLDEDAITVPTWQRFATAEDGHDRLEFPAVSVTDLIDSTGNRYSQDVDFHIREGVVIWGSRRPGVDVKTGKGVVCSVRYRYRPFFYVSKLLHEVRVGPVADPYTGERSMVRFPQSAMIQRETFFKKDQKNALNPNNPRTVDAPLSTPTTVPDGGFGPLV